MRRRAWWVIGVAAALLGAAGPAGANAGVPMLAVVWPPSWVLLLPVILLEALVARRTLGGTYAKAIALAAKANAASTLFGIPATWLGLVVLQMALRGDGASRLDTPTRRLLAVVVQSPWLMPYEGSLYWMVPAAALVLCVPFFLMSVWVEYLVARWCLPDEQRADARRWAWAANALSYGLICVGLVIVLLTARSG